VTYVSLIRLSLCLLLLSALSREQVRKEVKVTPTSLSIQIELDKDAAGKVVLINRSSADVRIWRMGNSWGDESLAFEVSGDNRTEKITFRPQVYTRNVPATVVVPHDGRFEILFNLRDGKWEPATAIDRLSGSDARLTAIYSVRKSPEAASQEVWTGELRSQPVRLK
jgi:hypothetical protein